MKEITPESLQKANAHGHWQHQEEKLLRNSNHYKKVLD